MGGIQIGANFQLLSQEFLDSRKKFNTLTEMVCFAETSLPDGFVCYCKEDKTYYAFESENDDDATLGKWREFSGGGDNTVECTQAEYDEWDLAGTIDANTTYFIVDGTYSFIDPFVSVSTIVTENDTTHVPSSNAVFNAIKTSSDAIDVKLRNKASADIYRDTCVRLSGQGSSGTNSFNFGYNCEASGNNSFATGENSMATSQNCHAEGSYTFAGGCFSAHAEGTNTQARGDYSHAEGRLSHAVGMSSHAEGNSTYANGESSHAEGANTKANEDCSHAEGNSTEANGESSHAEGIGSIADGYCSHAEGCLTEAKNNFCHTEGGNTEASGSCAHAEGNFTIARGDYCHSEGIYTVAGAENGVDGDCSHAEGSHTSATNYASHAGGKYNNPMALGGTENNQIGDAFVIGNGTGNDNLSNAFRVTYSGAVYGVGAYNTTGADYAEYMYEWADGNENNEDRVGYFVTVKNKKLYIANENDYVVGVVSGNPTIIGSSDEDYFWKYERDDFGRIVMEDAEELKKTIGDDGKITYTPTGNIIPSARMKVSDDYDVNLRDTYIERKKRKEWDYVGLLGQVCVRDNGYCIEDGFCKCGNGGIAIPATDRGFDTYRVLERINNNVIKILIK